MRWFSGLGLVLSLLLAPPAEVAWAPPGYCPNLFVPEGYEFRCEASRDEWRVTVRPEDKLVAPFSVLTMRPVREEVRDPDIWLREQLTLNLSEVGLALNDLLGRQESPLYFAPLSESLEKLVAQLRILDQLPLQSCGFPTMREGDEAWQIECDWELGPARLSGLMRVVYRGDEAYLVSLWATDPRRLRHLIAIANSF
jgi:hypothetical protein